MEKTQEAIFAKLKETMVSLETFLHSSKKLAVTVGKSFTHSSRPTLIDQDALSKLKLKLDAIRVTLKKADANSMDDAQDQLWMSELRDIECWAEDVVEDIQFELLRETKLEEFKLELLSSRKVKGKRKRGEDREVSLLFSAVPFGSLSFKIRRIADRYREIAMHREALHLKPEDGSRIYNPRLLLPSTSFAKSELFGRGDDMKKITELLLPDYDDNYIFSIIPIVGMAGVGKTTLVQHLFHNEIIKSGFDLMIWVSLSQKFDLVEVTRKILEVITKSPCALSELETLNSEVIGHLNGKKFMLVLDNMWDENHENWKRLMVLFGHGAKGSKVLVTTRSIKVGKMMCFKSHYLRCLCDDICWLVCKKLACHGRDLNLCPNLVGIGKKIVSKCRGLPLAAEAVGSMLSFSLDETHWRNVLDNHLWLDERYVSQVLPALVVSYEFLPLHLKRCFAYCSLFPKGYVFEKSKMAQLWIAQGFIPPNVGTKCFDDLVDRCFFQHSSYHYRTEGMFVVHDLYHELAQHVSCKEHSRTEDYKLQEIDERVRHSSLVPHDDTNKVNILQLGSFNGQNLRSLLLLGKKENDPDMVPFSLKFSNDIFKHLECLRALDLSNTDICELPNSIGNLIHLRYFSLENTRIGCLPESIGGFFNLLSMNLKRCYFLTELPKATRLLDNLIHLNLPLLGNNYMWMPSGIGQLVNLQNLSLFVVGNKTEVGSCQIEELRSLIGLKDELCISRLNNVIDAKFAEEANLGEKEKLQKVTLEWCMDTGSSSLNFCEKIASEVLEKLQPSSHLEELHIKGFPGNQFPSWLRNNSLSKLVSLDIVDCGYADKLPSLGKLPSLKHLSIQSVARLRYIGQEFNRGFPVLECILFKKMDLWEEWEVESEDFPCLKYLTLNSCGKLRDLPLFSPVVRIKVKNCPLLNSSISQTIFVSKQCVCLV